MFSEFLIKMRRRFSGMFSRFKALENYSSDELEQLQSSKVAIVGLGATGSVIAEHLARHGIDLVLIDRDYLEPNDCYSSQIYKPEQCEQAIPKAKAAEEHLSKFTEVETYVESLNPGNLDTLSDADLVMDGTDNMETRFLINDYCKKNGKKWIYTSALGEKGFSMLFDDECFNCVFDDIAAGNLETCETAGIMREVSNIAASISARKAVEVLTGKDVEETLDSVSGDSYSIEGGNCDVCEGESFPHLESRNETVAVCGENKYQVEKEADKKATKRLKERADSFEENDYLVRADLDGRSFTLFRDGRAIIEAQDKGHAEAIYSETIGV